MGLQNIVQKHGLERRDAPVGYNTWSNYIDARLEDVADQATERLCPSAVTAVGKKIRQELVQEYIIEDLLLGDLWEHDLVAETCELLAGKYLSLKLRYRRRKSARDVFKSTRPGPIDNQSRESETFDTSEGLANDNVHGADVAKPQAETITHRNSLPLFVGDTPTPEPSVEKPFEASHNEDVLPSEPVMANVHANAKVFTSIESSCSECHAALASERPVPTAPMTCAKVATNTHMQTQLTTPNETPSPVQFEKSRLFVRTTPVTTRSHAHAAPGPNTSASDNNELVTPATKLFISEAAATAQISAPLKTPPQMSSFYTTIRPPVQRPDFLGPATSDNTMNEASSRKRTREENVPQESYIMPSPRQPKLDPIKAPNTPIGPPSHPPAFQEEEKPEKWLCLIERLSPTTSTPYPGSTDLLSFTTVPNLAEFSARINKVPGYSPTTSTERLLIGDIPSQGKRRRFTLALTSDDHVGTWGMRAAQAHRATPGVGEGTIFVVDDPREGCDYKWMVSEL
jgi:hypothetical protein